MFEELNESTAQKEKFRIAANKLVNQFGTGRLALGKYESILLLILRLLYVEKRKELATFSEEVTVLMEEIREKYAC